MEKGNNFRGFTYLRPLLFLSMALGPWQKTAVTYDGAHQKMEINEMLGPRKAPSRAESYVPRTELAAPNESPDGRALASTKDSKLEQVKLNDQIQKDGEFKKAEPKADGFAAQALYKHQQ